VNKFENLVILEWHSITEPRAVATGCKHSTNLITSLMNQLSLGSGRYRSRLCNWVAFESPTNPPIYSQLRSDRVEPSDSQETEIHNSTEVA